ncbi:beta-ketoacyl synthase chain length factor [Azonexus sp.]|uniref:beta-ketoacyl synthase chain length factor n=1 Tax=Azonexus sp. TaxID=1872668 RepID=UPI0039E36B2F
MTTPPPSLAAWIDGIALIAPGLPDWPLACAVLRGEQPYQPAPSVLPAPSLLPSAERRRASRVVKLALALGLAACADAQADAATLATVFTASGADGHNCHALCEQLAGDDRQISPTRFHNSVHNAAAGYWGIATGATAPCQVIAGFDASFGAGLLDALAQVATLQAAVLLIAYDSEYPQPLHAKRATPDCAGVALLLSPQRNTSSKGQITLSLSETAPQCCADSSLENLRQNIPALRALPLLQHVAERRAGTCVLDYLPPTQLALGFTPC